MEKQLPVGSTVYFSNEKKPYKVRASDERFAVCTKPFNLRKTYFYTIIDLKENRRGPDNMIFHCYDLEKDRQCVLMLRHLERGKIELSHRRSIDLNILKVVQPKQN